MENVESRDGSSLTHESTQLECRRVLLTSVSDFPGPLAAFVEITKWAVQKGDHVYIGLWADKTIFSDSCSITARWLARLIRIETPHESVKRVLENVFRNNDKVNFIELPKNRSGRYHIARGRRISIEELQSQTFMYDGESYAIGASLIDGTRKSLSSATFRRTIINKFKDSYEGLVTEVTNIIKTNGIDTVVAFNGRRAHDHAILVAAELCKSRTEIYEMGATNSHLDLYSHGTHDRNALQKRMKMESQKLSHSELAFAQEWFTNRVQHLNTEANRFIKKQITGEGICAVENKKDIVYFVSSLDELASIGPEWGSPFGTQEKALKLINQLIEERPDFRLVVREHPFMGQMDRKSLTNWREFLASLESTTVIKADSSVDSYELINSAHAVISFGSTAGIEASYMGVPTLLIAPSFYDDLGVCEIAKNEKELREWLLNPKLPDNSLAGCQAYANFMLNRGTFVKGMEVLSPLHATSSLGLIGIPSNWKRPLIMVENRMRRMFW